MIPKNKYPNTLIKSAQYLGLGTQLAATVIMMVFLGKLLDESLNTYPTFLIVCSLFGSFAGIYNFIRTVLNLQKKSNEKAQEEKKAKNELYK